MSRWKKVGEMYEKGNKKVAFGVIDRKMKKEDDPPLCGYEQMKWMNKITNKLPLMFLIER